MEPSDTREQEQSIKDRKRLLYEDDPLPEDLGSRKPFKAYLKDTPAAPLSGGTKAVLWALAVLVGLLLLAAMLRGARGKPRPAPSEGAISLESRTLSS